LNFLGDKHGLEKNAAKETVHDFEAGHRDRQANRPSHSEAYTTFDSSKPPQAGTLKKMGCGGADSL
jgi:hypothetical protein